MSDFSDQSHLQAVAGLDAEQRFNYLITEVVANGEVWILTDSQGSVMLNTDDEDCVPVWPGCDFAADWATGEWAECEPMAIPLKQWQHRWTAGLEEDGFAVVVFPLVAETESGEGSDGLVVEAEELDSALRKALKKSRS